MVERRESFWYPGSRPFRWFRQTLCAGFLLVALTPIPTTAKDYFVTIGGGYAPRGNQASMEANVLFFQELLVRNSPEAPPEHLIYFADGDSPDLDVQTADRRRKLDEPQRLLAEILDWDLDQVEYRDHQIPSISGRNHPQDIESGLRSVIEKLQPGDRLFFYVTAHGGPAKGDNSFDTEIHCWDKGSIHARELAQWFEDVPREVPVVMVMAQCYCGGYSHTIFSDADQEIGLASGLRCGFFAQQHNLPAAGCRPDISNDQEYSSFFWGAICGRTRNGEPITSADCDGDGVVSLAEAHIYAVLASETIDIPMRCSDALLRVYSHTGDEESNDTAQPWTTLEATIDELLTRADFVNQQIIRGLGEQLEIDFQQPATSVKKLIGQERRGDFNRRRRGRAGSRQYRELAREMRDQLFDQWPELKKVEHFDDLSTLDIELGTIREEVEKWEKYERFLDLFRQREASRENGNEAELKQVKYKRLLQSLEAVVLAENLPLLAAPEVVDRYREILELERSRL